MLKVRTVELSVPEAAPSPTSGDGTSSALYAPDSVADAHKAEDFGASLCKQDEAVVEIFQSGWFGIL